MSYAKSPAAISNYVRFVDRIREIYKKSDPEEDQMVNQAAGWLIVSFFALNSGGIVAILNSDGRLQNVSLAGAFFFFGMVLSLLTGVLGIFAVLKVNGQTTEIVRHVSDFEESKYSTEFAEKLTAILSRNPERWLILPLISGFLAGGLALAGVATAYSGFEPYVEANRSRCLAIQRDMLSAHPRRSDGPDLFQALGCRPQGQGGVSAPPTDRERMAGHPLPWGGYPPSR